MVRRRTARSSWTGWPDLIARRTRRLRPSLHISSWSALGGDYVKNGYSGQVDAYRDAHQWKEATAVAAEVAKALPNDHCIQLMYAGQLADTGKVDQGVALAKAQLAATDRHADERDSHLALATIYTRLKRWQEASAELDTADALATKPDEKLYVYFLRGRSTTVRRCTTRRRRSSGRPSRSTRRTQPS